MRRLYAAVFLVGAGVTAVLSNDNILKMNMMSLH
jgi:hypothetical protein